MNARPPTPPSSHVRLPAYGLALTCAIHALAFTAAARVLPTVQSSWLALSLAPLAVLHAAVCVLALGRRARALATVWALLSLYSLLWLGTLTALTVGIALYLSELYRALGQTVAGALACVWGLFVLFTLPISAWGLAAARPDWLGRKLVARVGLVLAAGALLVALSLRSLAHAEPVAGTSLSAVTEALAEVARAHRGTAPDRTPRPLAWGEPLPCAEPVERDRATLLVLTLARDGAPLARCLQAGSASSLGSALGKLLEEQAAPDAPVKLDWVRSVQRIPRLHPLVDALSLRPALDGLCSSGRCFAPWQLVARDAFTQNRPFGAVRDASFGVALADLSRALGAHADAPLLRIETASWVADRSALSPLVRLRAPEVPTTPATLERAVAAAGRHILAAQRPDGTFRYLLDPFSGRTDDPPVNLRRQAGTLLALCELLPPQQVGDPAARALAQLRSFERALGPFSVLSDDPRSADLGRSALPLSAFATCRDAVGPHHDDLIGALTRFLLAMQRPDGSFHPELELATRSPRGAHETLYSAGQALLALVKVEQLARDAPSPHLPDRAALSEAVERAMRFYAEDYWPRPLRSLFYLEENWHCLAARAALGSHRNDAYERFCLDYTRFKRRLILEAGPEVSPEHVGGYALADMFPPHSTATAGYGEALAAAIPIARARGLDVSAEQSTLRAVLGFLLRQQWTETSCFACGAEGAGRGGFSESSASPPIRIDYVQHAMAALGHGLRALSLPRPPGPRRSP